MEFKINSKYYPLILFIGCILFIFSNLALYPLIDIDETRYVNMSKYMYLIKEYITPILNFEPFLEKPPLYFWLNIFSYKLFGVQNLFASRFSCAFLGSISIFATYYFVSFVSKNKLLGFLSANVLLSCVWFLVFSHIAILDMEFMVFSMLTIYCAVLPIFFEKEKNKFIFWCLAYFFMALSVLSKGFIGLAIPCGVVFFNYLAFKKIKELFKPSYLITGSIIFLLAAVPWHVLIYKAHGVDWVNMYILKHHFARLINSQGLGRKQPFLFYVPIIFAGLIPWTFNFIFALFKKINPKTRNIMIFSYIYFIFTFLFFSVASTKLPTYILTTFPALAIIVGNFWFSAIEYGENKKALKISNYINSSLYILVCPLGLIFSLIYKNLPYKNLDFYVKNALWFSIPALVLILCIALVIFIFNKKEKFGCCFFSHLILALIIVHTGFDFVLPYYTSFAQDELVEFANYIYEKPDSRLITYDMSTKYSVLNPKKKVIYIVSKDTDKYKKLMEYTKDSSYNNFYVIVKARNPALDNNDNFKKIKEGKAYKIYLIKK